MAITDQQWIALNVLVGEIKTKLEERGKSNEDKHERHDARLRIIEDTLATIPTASQYEDIKTTLKELKDVTSSPGGGSNGQVKSRVRVAAESKRAKIIGIVIGVALVISQIRDVIESLWRFAP